MNKKKDPFEHLRRGKKIKLSWLTKLKNSEFTASATIIYKLIEETIESNKYLPPNALKMLGDLIQQISNLAPTQRPHQLTQTINIAHTKRKKQLTAIRQYIKVIISASDIFSPSQVKSAEKIGEWLQDIYGTRHYDMGIGMLTAKTSTMFLMLDENSELMEAFEQCSYPGAIEELRESHNLVIDATLQRDIDMGERDLEPSFVEIRADIYKHIKALVEFIKSQLTFNLEVEMMIHANYMLYNYINPKQANYKQQATKRRLARERQEKQKLDSTIDMESISSTLDIANYSRSY